MKSKGLVEKTALLDKGPDGLLAICRDLLPAELAAVVVQGLEGASVIGVDRNGPVDGNLAGRVRHRAHVDVIDLHARLDNAKQVLRRLEEQKSARVREARVVRDLNELVDGTESGLYQ